MASCVRPINVAIATRRPSDISLPVMTLAFAGNYEHVHIRHLPISDEYRTYMCFTDVVMAALASAQKARRESAADIGLSVRREEISLLSEDRKNRRCFEIIVCVSAVDVGPFALHVPTDTLPEDLYEQFGKEAQGIITRWASSGGSVPVHLQQVERGIQNALDRSLFIEKTEYRATMN